MMEPHVLDSLTPSERTVLRVLLRERDQKAIARQLDLSPETVKTHLRNAREKTGVSTSFALARAFAEWDPSTPERGIPLPEGEPSSSPFGRDGASKRPVETDRHDEAFHEGRAVFDFDHSSIRIPPLRGEGRRNPLSASTRLMVVAGMGIMLVALIVLAFPLSESFQRLADVLDPPKH